MWRELLKLSSAFSSLSYLSLSKLKSSVLTSFSCFSKAVCIFFGHPIPDTWHFFDNLCYFCIRVSFLNLSSLLFAEKNISWGGLFRRLLASVSLFQFLHLLLELWVCDYGVVRKLIKVIISFLLLIAGLFVRFLILYCLIFIQFTRFKRTKIFYFHVRSITASVSSLSTKLVIIPSPWPMFTYL